MPTSHARRAFIAQGAAASLALVAGWPARAAEGFTRLRITDLGDLGGPSIQVRAISEQGVAVGAATRHGGDNKGVAFRSEGGHMRGLRLDRPSVSSCAVAINASGVVAGWDADNLTPNFLLSSWTWQGAERQYLPKNAVTDSVSATDFNDAGVATGNLYPVGGVLWRDGQMVDLSTETGLTIWSADAINQAGDIVGMGVRKHKFLSYLYRQGVATLLDVLGSPQHEATDINNAGQVCGRYRQTVDERRAHGYLWQDGVAIDLGQLPGPEQSIWPLALNDASAVVGTSSVIEPGSPRVPHAFIWQGGTMVDLNRLIDGDHDGWVLNKAVDINNLGQIVGQATRHGVARAFLATPV